MTFSSFARAAAAISSGMTTLIFVFHCCEKNCWSIELRMWAISTPSVTESEEVRVRPKQDDSQRRIADDDADDVDGDMAATGRKNKPKFQTSFLPQTAANLVMKRLQC